MNISAKGRYAIMLMLDLAVYNTGKPICVKDIAKRQNISIKFLEQIMSILKKAGDVISIRGPQGGYMLRRDPSEYTVGMILRRTEGNLSLVENINLNGEDMVTDRIWKQLNQAVSDVVDHITLADLVEWSMEKADQYVI